MASQTDLHFVLLPFLAQGHLIPMIDMARLLSQHGVAVSIVTTPLNAAQFATTVDRAVKLGLRIQLLQVPFPSAEAGLPDGCERLDFLPSNSHVKSFFVAVKMLQKPTEKLLSELSPRPSCIISDKHLIWGEETARIFQIPRLVFDGTSCFSYVISHNIRTSRIRDTVSGELEYFVVPNLPDHVELTKAQLPGDFSMDEAPFLKQIREEIRETELRAYGMVVNTFDELEAEYVRELRRVRGDKFWCIGPVSLCNRENLDKAERGGKGLNIDETGCLKWLDSWDRGSVIYACMGSLSRLTIQQMIELGLGLESSNRPFIWVISGGSKVKEFEKWLTEARFEERISGRGLLIRGWAPQTLILAHIAIGGFLTHCGWNSTLEGICAGVPMMTWPIFAEQFYNERFIVDVSRIGVKVGVELSVRWGEEEKCGVMVKREQLKEVIEEVMNEGENAKERKNRARKLAKKANRAMERDGSSYLNMQLMIQEIEQRVFFPLAKKLESC